MALDTIRLKSLAGAPPPPPPEQSDFQRYLNSVMRHKWLVLAITVVGTLAGVVATRFLDPRYTAKAILWVDVAVGRDRGVQSDQLLDSRGWVELVTSNAVLDTVVKQRRLFLQPATPNDSAALTSFDVGDKVVPGTYRLVMDKAGRAFRLEMEDGTVVQRGRAGQPVGENLGFDWTPTGLKSGTITFTVKAIPDASATLAQDIKARLDPAGNFLRLQLKSSSAAGAAATLNAISERIVAVETDMKRRKFQELTTALSEQYDHAKENLSQADEALRSFRVRTADRPMVTQTPSGSLAVEGSGLASELRNDIEQRRRDRNLLNQFASRAATGSVSVELWNSLPSVQKSPYMQAALLDLGKKQADLRALRLNYTEEAAPVRQLQSEVSQLEHQQIPSLARMLAQDLGEVVATTQGRADTAVGRLRAAPNLALEQDQLVRQQRMAADQFTSVDREYETAKLGLISALPDVRVLDPAVEPRRPASDYGPLLILLAALASFGVAVMGVTLKDKMDPKVRYPEQITGRMQLQILGAVPHVSWRLGANGDGSAQVIEALRGLRLRVLHAHAGDGPLTLTITSPGIGDGKSFVSLNLALSFADAGYRTLLVDGDTRRGVQHKALKTPSTPGLTDVVAGRVQLDAALRQTSYPGLTFLSSGTRMQRAPERLLSQTMRDLMAKLRSMYDVVLVDSPPLGAGADPLVLGTLTENLMLVLRTGQSDINLASTKLEVLNALPVRVIGAVLNDVRSSGVYRYYMYSSAEYELVDDEGPTREALPSILGGRT
ncbi:MAG TPA: polysaccharide biosynthesis tyrosine autokinase [Gemmatimonadales bacterium]|jgi:capsular exopolysaccharide synthesis family protein|nr:polysaccharide biosynthesis tyrosine autokinase [Gemmatimonadales bacterium]